MNRNERQKYAREAEIVQRRFENKYFNKVEKTIRAKVNEVIRNIQYYGNIHDGINNLHRSVASNTALSNTVKDLYLEVGLQFARRTWRDLQAQKRNAKGGGFYIENGAADRPLLKGFGFNAQWVEFIKNYLFRFLLDKITFGVAETTREVLLNVLNQAITEGWGVNETVKHLDELPFTASQAARIVRTEITRAANTGAMAAGSTFEFEQAKEWIAAHDSRTRGGPTHDHDHANHWSLDGIVVNYDDVFHDPVNGDKLRFPGDPNASASSTVNCRCSVAVIAKRDSNNRLIPKRKTTYVQYPKENRV